MVSALQITHTGNVCHGLRTAEGNIGGVPLVRQEHIFSQIIGHGKLDRGGGICFLSVYQSWLVVLRSEPMTNVDN